MYFPISFVYLLVNVIKASSSQGLMMLYEPLDITYLCIMSNYLHYDISFGMGMSDTITLELKTQGSEDYKCIIEIESDEDTYIIVVIQFENTFKKNCKNNKDAFILIKDNKCIFLCDVKLKTSYGKYFTVVLQNSVKFIFSSKSSINADMHVPYYLVTVTSARKGLECLKQNETKCIVRGEDFCITNGVVCDGIKHCGVADWYDERRNNCGMPVDSLGLAPVITIVAAVFCALLAGGHILMKFLPPVANSFFIFNVNEDNRLYLHAQLRPPTNTPFSRDRIIKKKHSLIPISSSTTTEDAHCDGTSSEEVITIDNMDTDAHEQKQHTVFHKYSKMLTNQKFFKTSQSKKSYDI